MAKGIELMLVAVCSPYDTDTSSRLSSYNKWRSRGTPEIPISSDTPPALGRRRLGYGGIPP